jgi:MTH538 TIR-like domain (DUF1863)
MARRTFFSFHYERDCWRASQVRNSWVTQDRESAGFWDAAAWEEVKKKGTAAIEKWIDDQLKGTSVTVVLIGSETANREYVGYEIKQSHIKGNGMLGIYIHNMKDANSKTDTKGRNPFDNWQVEKDGNKVLFSSLYPTYDWVNDDGRGKMGIWIEAAAKKAGC